MIVSTRKLDFHSISCSFSILGAIEAIVFFFFCLFIYKKIIIINTCSFSSVVSTKTWPLWLTLLLATFEIISLRGSFVDLILMATDISNSLDPSFICNSSLISLAQIDLPTKSTFLSNKIVRLDERVTKSLLTFLKALL